MHRLCPTLLLLMISMTALCQLQEDFSSSDLMDWIGDTDAFIVNAENRLQLMDTEGGSSSLFRAVSYPDSIIWRIDLEMDFSPSTSNQLNIFLALDNTDLSAANGYLLEIGENGSNDAIHLVELNSGTRTTLASGIPGQVGSDFYKSLVLTYDTNDMWTLTSGDAGNLVSELEFEVQQEALIPTSAFQFFGLSCSYTSTRADKFYFDNIFIEEIIPDTSAPELSSSVIRGTDAVLLSFSEALDNASALNINNYTFSNGINIIGLEFFEGKPNQILITADQDFPKGENFTLTVSGINDRNFNTIENTSIDLFIYATPSLGDLLVNEILFDPLPDEFDYVEIKNISNKDLDITGLVIANLDKDEKRSIDEQLILSADGIIAFSEDTTLLISTYNPPSAARLYEMDLPSYNNSDGNVAILYDDGNGEIILDSFDYEEDYHQSIYSDVEGISLERISQISDTNDPSNWTSASEDFNFGTPGYENSSRVSPNSTSDKTIFLEYKTFTPNADGDKDLMILNYKLDKAGYVLNASILDDQGRHELDIVTNKTIGTNGFVRWDGLREDNTPAPIGMYIIYYEFFHPDGQVIDGKEVVVLGQNLN